MALTRELRDGQTIIRILVPTIDATTVKHLKAPLMQAAAEHSSMIIDLSQVVYLDLLGFETLLDAALACPGGVRFGGANREIRALFQRNNLDSLLQSEGSVTDSPR